MDEGLELWKLWFEWSGDPWITDDYGRTDCFFCTKDHPNHYDDCIFEKARKLVENDSVSKTCSLGYNMFE